MKIYSIVKKIIWTSNTKSEPLICTVFPSKCKKLSLAVAQHIDTELNIPCVSVNYIPEKLNRSSFEKIKETIEKAKVTIIGYTDELEFSHYYKLGYAHACQRKTILLDISSQVIDGGGLTKIPEYVSYEFAVKFRRNDAEKSFQYLEKIVSILLSENIESILYEKSLFFCRDIERKLNRKIDKVDQITFQKKLNKLTSNFNNYTQASGISLDIFYLGLNEYELKVSLLCLLAKNKFEIINIIRDELDEQENLNVSDSISKDTIDILNKKTMVVNNNNYYFGDKIIQKGFGDNYAGDKVKKDKNTYLDADGV